jgi:hypothetical protein
MVNFRRLFSKILSESSKDGFPVRVLKVVILFKEQVVNDKIAIFLVGGFKLLAAALVLFEIGNELAIMMQMTVGESLFFFGTGLKFLFFFFPQKLVRILFDRHSYELVLLVLEKTLMGKGQFGSRGQFFRK